MREYDINPGLFDITQSILKDRDVLQRFGARIHVLRFELFGNCLARLCQSFEYRCGEGFHVNSSWTILWSHSVSVEEIRVFQACTCVNR